MWYKMFNRPIRECNDLYIKSLNITMLSFYKFSGSIKLGNLLFCLNEVVTQMFSNTALQVYRVIIHVIGVQLKHLIMHIIDKMEI